jgi:hypothetical protein
MTNQGKLQGSTPRRQSDSEMWDRMAAWWDEKQGEDGDRWHRLLIDPPFERVMNPPLKWRACPWTNPRAHE